MSYHATVIPVMIASPGDVEEERAIVRDVINDWNDVNSLVSKVVLTPVSWETHSSPELGARPQELINSRILKNCDLLIGVFWTRLGTPTGKAASGTVEEIQEHQAAGKPAMIYFSSRPMNPAQFDAKQMEELRQFREWCMSQGLIETFENANQFKEKLSKQLSVCVNNNSYLTDIINVGAAKFDIETIVNKELKLGLTEDAIRLLKAAASREDGRIMKSSFIGGRLIYAGGDTFGGSSRENAKWENVLNELEQNDLVAARGYKGEIYELTHQGWTVADQLLQSER